MQITFYKKILVLVLVLPFLMLSCKGPDGKFKLPGGDARKTPADPAKRIEQNIKEGKGFRLNDTIKRNRGGGVFEFASSNGLWKASLDIIDFMPLSSVNYSGGIIVTDWYSENNNPNESIKISIRFLTNELRSDALDVKIFNRKCTNSLIDCKFSESSKDLANEIKKEILKKAAIYKAQIDEKKNTQYKDYKVPKNFGNISESKK
jgi:hypothetical protein